MRYPSFLLRINKHISKAGTRFHITHFFCFPSTYVAYPNLKVDTVPSFFWTCRSICTESASGSKLFCWIWLRIQVQAIWLDSDPDPDPGYLVESGSGSRSSLFDWIRIRIHVQSIRLNSDPDPGPVYLFEFGSRSRSRLFNDQKLINFTVGDMQIFYYKNCNIFKLRYRISLQPSTQRKHLELHFHIYI